MFIISPALWGLAKAGAMGASMIPADSYDVSQIRSVLPPPGRPMP